MGSGEMKAGRSQCRICSMHSPSSLLYLSGCGYGLGEEEERFSKLQNSRLKAFLDLESQECSSRISFNFVGGNIT